MNPSNTRALLEKYGITLKKALGQNFLIEPRIPEKIVEGAEIGREDGVLEIGAGAGALTAVLCREAGRVAAVELDGRMIPILRETLSEFDNLSIIEGDALKVNLREIVQTELNGLSHVACANLPYYITTPIIERLLEGYLFVKVCVMVQKEVARRICALPGTSDYSSFTVYCAYYSTPKILFDVPAGCFVPRPNVDSSVVLFECRSEPLASGYMEKLFFRTLRAAFGERRKTLVNNLAREFGTPKDVLAEIVVQLGFFADVRGERLGLQDFLRLAEHMNNV